MRERDRERAMLVIKIDLSLFNYISAQKISRVMLKCLSYDFILEFLQTKNLTLNGYCIVRYYTVNRS